MDEALRNLVEEARGGDRAAFGRLVAAVQDRAVAFAYGKLGNVELAKDAAQDAFIDAFAHLAELRTSEAFLAWFRLVLRKHCDRRYRRRHVDLQELAHATPVATVNDCESTAIDAERVRWLRGAVDALPEGQRLVVALHYLAEQSLEQIGELLAIEPNAVKQRLHAARKRLQQTEAEPKRTSAMEVIMQSARASSDPAFADTVQLFLATRSGDVEVVRALLERNPALVDARECWSVHDFAGCALPPATKASPLIRAAELGQLAIVELLLQSGADIDGACGCVTRESPLWAAAASNRIDAVELLLRHGADPNRAGVSGIAPLHIAAMRGSQALLELLLAHGAVPEQTDPSGRKAGDWAQRKGHTALAARLGQHEMTIGTAPCPQPAALESVWQSGIKAIDLFAPIAHGALVRVEGRPNSGRNVLLAELAYHASSHPDLAVLWVSWEHERWSGSELELLLSESALCGRVHLLRHAHGRDANAGHLLAERALAFADGLLAGGGAQHLHLVFFEQAGARAGVEALLPALRSRPNVTTFFVGPWSAETAVLAPPFDTLLAFDPVLAQAMCFPALDPVRSCSRPMPSLAGADIAERARALLQQDDPRARRLRAYLTQPFFVAEPNSGRPGERVARGDMLADTTALMAGAADGWSEAQLSYRGRAPVQAEAIATYPHGADHGR